MAEKNVVRQDVVQVTFDMPKNPCQDIIDSLNEMKNKAIESVSCVDKSFKGIKKSAQDAQKNVSGVAKKAQGLGNSSGSVSKFTKAFQSTNRAIQDGEKILKNFKSSIKNMPHNAFNKISTGLIKMKLQTATVAGSLKILAKTKLSNLKQSVEGTVKALKQGEKGGKGFVNMLKSIGKISVAKTAQGIDKVKSGLKNVAQTSLNKLVSGLKNVSTKLSEIAKKAAGAAFNALKKVAGVSFKALGAGIAAATVAVGALVKKSVTAYGDYEQLVGGVETLFGAGGAKNVQEYAKSVGKSVEEVKSKYESLKKSESTVLANANKAYKTAGLSANNYMETVTSFSASLLQSLGGDTQKAAAKADMAIIDMADNANKMGTPMESIQNAYQGFAKQNYTMLDNLKLGYGGTKEEMQRLLKDAQKISGVKYDLSNLADVYDAIHVIQTELGITDTTKKEAEGTIQGSMNMMKASWENMLVALVTGGTQFDQCIDELVYSVETFAKNVMPAVKGALEGVGVLIQNLAPIISAELPSLVESLVPNLITAAMTIINGVTNALPSLVTGLLNVLQQSGSQIILTLVNSLNQAAISILGMLPQFITVGAQLLTSLVQGIAQALPTLIPAIVQSFYGMVNALVQQIPAFIESGIQLLQGLVQGMLSALPIILQQAPTIIQNLVSGINKSLPMIIEAGVQLINQLITGIIGMLPSIIPAGLQIINSLVNCLIQNLPVIINGAIQLINALVNGLIENLPMIIQAAQQLITGLTNGLIANLPTIIQSAIQLILTLANALINNITILIPAAVQLIIGVAQGLLDNLPTIIQAAVEIIVALAVGLIESIPTLLSAVPEVFGALWDAIKNIDWLDLGKKIINSVWEGIKSIGKGLWNGIKGLFSDDGSASTEGQSTGQNYTSGLTSGINTSSIANVGQNATSSLATGMSKNVGAVTTASTNISKTMSGNIDVNGMKDKGLESSKSVASGIKSGTSTVTKQAKDLSSGAMKTMTKGIKDGGKDLSDTLVSVWTEAAKASVAPVNKILDGANTILKQFGSDKRMTPWTPYAKGTSGHKGGNALVNDGRGAELVQMPNGMTFIPRGRNVLIPNAPKGMKVLSAENTANVMGKRTPTFNYAEGTGFDVWDYIDNASGLIDKIKSGVSYSSKGLGYYIAQGMVNTITGEMTHWVKKKFDEYGAKGLANYIPSGGVEQWRSTVIQALKMEGQYSEANVRRTLYQMQTESGGNPYAINLWDSNAKKGIPSKGLMQCIDPTFQAYARPGFNKNIYDPLSNILASIRYAVSRYGSLARAYQGHGYANGAIVSKPTWGVFGEAGKEALIPLSKNKRKRGLSLWATVGSELGIPEYSPDNSVTNSRSTNNEYNTYSPSFTLNMNGASATDSNKRKVKKWIRESIKETFESMGRTNPELIEV